MQQTCSNCRYPLQPGAVVCTNCGTPVSAPGGGSYDPTVRAGVSPGSGYGQPPYGAPSAPDPYGAQYSNPSPYGAPPGGSAPYGPPPAGPYGAPPPQPGFGGPPPYGAPVGYPGQVIPKKSHTGLYIGLGVVGVILVVAIVGCIFVVGLIGTAAKKVSNAINSVEATATAFAQQGGSITTGTHITKIAVGTGIDQTTETVTGETATFSKGSTVYVSFTVDTQETGAQVVLKLYAGSDLQDTSDTVTPDPGTTTYGNSATVNIPGVHSFEVDYNGVSEATITFNVT
jgi:hypothetical protein